MGITSAKKGTIIVRRINMNKASRPGKLYLAKANPAREQKKRTAAVVVAVTNRVFNIILEKGRVSNNSI